MTSTKEAPRSKFAEFRTVIPDKIVHLNFTRRTFSRGFEMRMRFPGCITERIGGRAALRGASGRVRTKRRQAALRGGRLQVIPIQKAIGRDLSYGWCGSAWRLIRIA